jgi:Tfp pilus tip-associated adhesin PilY1
MLFILLFWHPNSTADKGNGSASHPFRFNQVFLSSEHSQRLAGNTTEAANQRRLTQTVQPASQKESAPVSQWSSGGLATGMAVGTLESSDRLIVYQSRCKSSDWSGDLVAFGAQWESGQLVLESSIWQASDKFQAADLNWRTRRIITLGGGADPRGVPFRYASLSDRQRAILLPDSEGQFKDPDDTRELIAYLRGKPSTQFRLRNSQLGDIINAAPVLAGDTLYVGANDGMLHAFDAHSGHERFAYVPNLVFGHTRDLGRPDYEHNHRFFVDATPTVGQVLVGKYKRRTYLVGGLGNGGRGFYCLLLNTAERTRTSEGYDAYHLTFNIDDFGPDDQEEQISRLVQWEYPSGNLADDGMDNDGDSIIDEPDEQDPHMGYSYSQAYAVNANAPMHTYRPVVIFGNGYNSPYGGAMLYVLDACSGRILRKIDTGATGGNGLSTPALIDIDLDRRIDYAYAGDLQGNLWKFDLTAPDPAQWGVVFGQDLNNNGTIDTATGDIARPLFQVPQQPITGRPDVMAMSPLCNPQAQGYMVVFGTGKYLDPEDLDNAHQNGIFGIRDYGGNSKAHLGVLIDRTSGRLSSGMYLKRQKMGQTQQDDNTAGTVQNFNANKTVGWFVVFAPTSNAQGLANERVVGKVAIRGGQTVVASFVPEHISGGTGNGGLSRVYMLDTCSGTAANDAEDYPRYPRTFDGCMTSSPVIIKNPAGPHSDHLLNWSPSGRMIQTSFRGELQGKIYWRQNGG